MGKIREFADKERENFITLDPFYYRKICDRSTTEYVLISELRAIEKKLTKYAKEHGIELEVENSNGRIINSRVFNRTNIKVKCSIREFVKMLYDTELDWILDDMHLRGTVHRK